MSNVKLLGIILLLVGLAAIIYYGMQVADYQNELGQKYLMHIEKEYYQKELNKSIVWIIFGVATCIIGIVILKKTDSKSSFYHTGCNHNNQLGNYCSKCGIGHSMKQNLKQVSARYRCFNRLRPSGIKNLLFQIWLIS